MKSTTFFKRTPFKAIRSIRQFLCVIYIFPTLAVFFAEAEKNYSWSNFGLELLKGALTYLLDLLNFDFSLLQFVWGKGPFFSN